MSLYNELPTAFPWYEKLEQQNRYIETVQQGCDYKLITPKNALLPFEFAKVIELMPVTWLIIEANKGTTVFNVAIAGKVRKVTRAGKDYIYYDGSALKTTQNVNIAIPYGFYYSRLEFTDGSRYYSEMFHVPDLSFNVGATNINYLKIEWWNDNDIAPIFYNDKVAGKPYFRNIIYTEAFISQSEPEVIQEGEKDGNDEVIITFSKVVIKYRISDLMPDYLKKAIVVAQIHDHILINTKQNARSGEVEKIDVITSPEDDAAYSNVDILFEDTVAMVKKGCNENMV